MLCVTPAAAHLHIAQVSSCLAGWLVASLELRDRTVRSLFIHAILSWPGMLAVG